jgi:hypothetical protein
LGNAKAPLLSPPHVDTLYVPATTMDILSRRKLKPESVPWLNAPITEWESFLANLAEHQDAEISQPEGLECDADCQPYYYDEDLKRRSAAR